MFISNCLARRTEGFVFVFMFIKFDSSMPFLPSCVTTTDLFEEKPGWILSKFVCKYPVSEKCFRGRRDEMIMQP